MITVRRAGDRGHSEFGWLDSYHTFSFGHYHDPKHMGFESLRVINDDKVSGGAGFGTHSHRDMEIISYVLSGALQHNDSMGNLADIKAGQFQYICAGTGIEHSEYNASEKETVHFLQIWIVPKQKGLKPHYAELNALPDSNSCWQLICSPGKADGSIQINQDVNLYLGKLSGTELKHLLNKRPCWLHVAGGEVKVNEVDLKEGDGISVMNEEQISLISRQKAEVLMFDFLRK